MFLKSLVLGVIVKKVKTWYEKSPIKAFFELLSKWAEYRASQSSMMAEVRFFVEKK